MQFLNKVVLISGAEHDPGNAIALHFAKRSARLSLVGKNKDDVKKTADICEKVSKTKVLVNIIDSYKDFKRVVEDTLKEYGRIDVVVNCIKRNEPSNIADANVMEIFDKSIETNVKSVVALTHYAVKPLSKTRGVVLNILGCSAKVVTANVTDDVTESLLDHLTKHLALELAPKCIRVNAILPYEMSNEDSKTKVSAPKLILSNGIKGDFSQVPLKKLVKSEDVAELATFLASQDAKSITGSSYIVDAGALLLR